MKYTISSVTDLGAIQWAKLADGDELVFDPGDYKARLCLHRGIKVYTNPNAGTKAHLDCANAPMYGKEVLRVGYHRDFFSANAGVLSAAPTGLPGFTAKGYTGPPDVKISNLEITGAPNGVYSWWADGLEIDSCYIHDNLQGVFNVGTGQTHDLWIHGCEFSANGNPGSYRQHQLYLEALGVTFEDNVIHNPIPSFQGSAYKSRSGGEIIRNNVIKNGGFCLDLCDPQESNYIHIDPRFHDTLVEGNTFVQDETGGTYFIHFGDDQISRNQDPNGVYADGRPMRPHPEKSRPHLTMKNNGLSITKPKMTRFCLFDLRANDNMVACDSLAVGAKNGAVSIINDYGICHLTNCTLPSPHAISARALKGTVTGG